MRQIFIAFFKYIFPLQISEFNKTKIISFFPQNKGLSYFTRRIKYVLVLQ